MTRLAMAVLFGAVAAAAPQTAQACGGFFCSQVPIDQTGERVLFAVEGGEVEAHIQIFYQGSAERFAWVLPLPQAPTVVKVGTDMLFQQLESRTRPQFQVQWVNNNGCWYNGGGGDFLSDGAPNAGAGGADPDDDGVKVLEQDTVGPYDYVVLEGTSATSGEALFEWLNDNGFDQPPIAKDHISTYVAEQHKFVAIKLTSDADVGDIQPLVLRFPFPGSCVPLRLTSIAAQENMDVWVYMLGQQRAVPINFFHVEINEKLIDWVSWGSNYKEIASDAVDTAAGRGFLTEYAGDTNDMKSLLWKPGIYDTAPLLELDKPWDFVDTMLALNFPRTPQMQQIIRTHIPKPDSLKDTTDQQFYNNLDNFKSQLSELEFDPAAMVADIETKIFEPLKDANELFNKHRYMTRMYTIISPEEMLRDPIFLFNGDLPNVSNVHRATGKAVCKPGSSYEAEKVIITLADGTELKYDVPEQWGPAVLEDADSVGGAAASVERMFTSGEPEVIAAEDINDVDKEFDSITLGLVTEPTVQPNVPPKGGSSPSAGGCTAGSTGSYGGVALLIIIALGAFGLRRRRSGLAAAVVTVATMTAAVPTAEACGGFFCNNVPIVQKGERVLFGVDNGEVTTHVQIFYQGAAERFAWVLPIPAEPTHVSVGTDTLFTQLGNLTRPRFNTQWVQNNKCWFYGWGYESEFANRAGAPTADSDGEKQGVEVLQEASVGPYDYVVIKGTTTDSGDAVFEWLAENGYEQPDLAKDLVTTYVAENHLFVAVKLQNESDVGDIQPITLKYPFEGGCVPLRLTSIAATEDMDIWVYMLGQHRAVPINYFHVEVNEKKIDWVRGGNNYKELAKDAVDTAAGRGFMTEYAGDTNGMKGLLWKPGVYNTEVLLEKTKPWEFVDELLTQNFPRTAQMQNLIRKHIPKPESLKDTPDQSFYNGLASYKTELLKQPFDAEAFVADIEAKVFAPLMEANALFDQFRYMTRMYTIISPNEMLRDPIFLYNPDLPNVSNVHNAVGKATCKPGSNNQVESIEITLENGETLNYEGPFDYQSPLKIVGGEDALGGSASKVERMYTSGAPEVVAASDVNDVDKEFDSITVGLVVEDNPRNPRPRTSTNSAGAPSAGCTVSGVALPITGFALLIIMALGILFVARTRED